MKRVTKILLILYFLLVFPIIFVAADFFILTSNPRIYSFIPQDADIVIEINAKNFIKEVAYQRIYNESYFLEKLPPSEEEPLFEESSINTGIDYFSQIIIFRENWAEENIWYAVLKVDNNDIFQNYLAQNNIKLKSESNNGYTVLQLTKSLNQDKVDEHLVNLAQNKIKSFDARIDLSEKFDPKNELNIFVAPKNSSQIIDGYIFLNFNRDKISINGNISPTGDHSNEHFTAYNVNTDKALTLRSSLNIFKSVYFFNNQSLDNLPTYEQLALDFDGSTLITSNESNPIKALPSLNLMFEFEDSLEWSKYFNDYTSNPNVSVSENKIQIIGEANSEIKYKLSQNQMQLFQNDSTFSLNENANTYFELNIKPELFLERTIFVEDESNPPSFISSIKIGIMQTLMEEMAYWELIENINVKITEQPESHHYIADGEIDFSNKNGHSIIESIVITQNFVGTIGAFLETE